MKKQQDLKNFKIETLINLGVGKERVIKDAEKKLAEHKAKLDEINALIKEKQKAAGLSDKDMEEMRKKAEEGFNPPDVCPL